MSEQLELIIKANTKALDDIKAKLQSIEKQSDETASKASKAADKASGLGQKMASSFGGFLKANILLNIANQLQQIVVGSVEAGKKLDNAFARLESAAKKTGQSFADLKNKSIELAADNALSLDQSANALSKLVSSGLDAQKALDLSEAVKKLVVLNTEAENVEATFAKVTKELSEGDTRPLELLGDNMKIVIKEFGGGGAILTDFNKRQELFNEIIKRSSEVNEEYAKTLKTTKNDLDQFLDAAGDLGQALASKPGRSILDKITDFIPFAKGIKDTIVGLTKVFNDLTDAINAPGTGPEEQYSQALQDIAQSAKTISDANLLKAIKSYNEEIAKLNKGAGTSEDAKEKIKTYIELIKLYERELSIRKAAKGKLGTSIDVLKNEKSTSDFLLNDLERQLDAIGKALEDFRKSAQNTGDLALTEAEKKAEELADAAIASYAKALNDSNKTDLQIRLEQIAAERQQQKNIIDNLRKAGQEGAATVKEAEADRIKLRQEIEALTDALGSLTDGIFSLEKAIAEGNIGAALTAGGSTLSATGNTLAGLGAISGEAGKTLGTIGGVAGLAGGVVSGIVGILDRQQALAEAKAAAARKEIEDHNRKMVELAQKNADIVQTIYDIEKRRLDLIDQRYDRQNTLLELSGKKQSAILQAQIKADEKRLAGLIGPGASKDAQAIAEATASKLTETGRASSQLQSALSLLQASPEKLQAQVNAGAIDLTKALQFVPGTDLSRIAGIQDLLGSSADLTKEGRAKLQSQLEQVLSRIELVQQQQQTTFDTATDILSKQNELATVQFSEKQSDYDRFIEGLRAAGATPEEIANEQVRLYTGLANKIKESLGITEGTNLATFGLNLKDTQDIENFNTLTGLLDAIKTASEVTAENTDSLKQVDERALSFIDIGRGFVDRGVAGRLNVNPENLQLTSGVSSFSSATVQGSGSPELNALQALVSLSTTGVTQRDLANKYLADIVTNLQRSGGAVQQSRQAANQRQRSIG